MQEVTETHLPGVGVRHEFRTSSGERIAVLSHRTGRRELAIYSRLDPDACSTVLKLSPDDTHTLADLLGGSPLSEAALGVQRLAGVAIDWIAIPQDANNQNATIGERQLRTRTGASVVALVRGEDTIAAPAPEEPLTAGDIVVAVGTSDGLRQLRDLLEA